MTVRRHSIAPTACRLNSAHFSCSLISDIRTRWWRDTPAAYARVYEIGAPIIKQMKQIIEPAALINDLLVCAAPSSLGDVLRAHRPLTLGRAWCLIRSGPDESEFQILQCVRGNVSPMCGSSLVFWSAKNLNFKLFWSQLLY